MSKFMVTTMRSILYNIPVEAATKELAIEKANDLIYYNSKNHIVDDDFDTGFDDFVEEVNE